MRKIKMLNKYRKSWNSCRRPCVFLTVARAQSFCMCFVFECVLNIFFHQMSSSVEGRPPSKVVFHGRSSSIQSCLPSTFMFHRSSSSIKDRTPSKVICHDVIPIPPVKGNQATINLIVQTKKFRLGSAVNCHVRRLLT